MPESSQPKTPPASRTLEDVIAEKQGTLSPTDTLAEAGDKMRALNVDSMPVSDGRRLVGMVDQPNPDRAAAGHGHDPNDVQIGESMNREVVYCFEDQTTAEALRTMDEAKLDEMPVLDRQQKIVGTVSREDLAGGSDAETGAMPD